MTSSVIGMQQQQLEQDERLLCLRILNVDSDEVHQTVVVTNIIIITALTPTALVLVILFTLLVMCVR
jgi:hypothetical protein